MGYRLEKGEPLPAGLKRIATEQVERALMQLTEMPDGRDEAVHDARKCFKKVRAVLRLARNEIGPEHYKQENICYRDAGRQLSDVRDSFVIVETLDGLAQHFAGPLDSDAFAGVRQTLVERHESIKEQILDEEQAMANVTKTIRAARQRIANWPIENDDFSALRGGLKRVYKRGRNRMADAYANPQPEHFHEWRKRVKYLWYHVRIFKPLWPDLLKELAGQLHDLSDYLGDDHDLVQLRHAALEQPQMFNAQRDLKALVALIDRRRLELETLAQPLGERIYAETPGAFVDRIQSYWQASQAEATAPKDLLEARL